MQIRLHTLFAGFTLLIALLLVSHQPAKARPVIADLSLRQIAIDSGFEGQDILLFGARNDAGSVVVVVRGPDTPYVVRKKEPVLGMWLNRKQGFYDGGYGYYAIASSRPLDEIRNAYLLNQMQIGVEQMKLEARYPQAFDDEFKEALLNHKIEEQLFQPEIGEVSFIGETLFRTIIRFPDNIPRGVYTAEVYLFSDGQLTGIQTTPLRVVKTGFDAFVYDLAYENSALYGLLAISLALFAGWSAGLVFKKVGT